MFQSWERIYGGGVARDAVLGQLRWSASLLKATCPERLRPELFSAVGDLANIAGRMAEDSGAHEQAREIYHGALACAEQAGDWHLRAYVLNSLAGQSIRTGQPDEGLTQVEHALVRADRLTATELTLLHATRGMALVSVSKRTVTRWVPRPTTSPWLPSREGSAPCFLLTAICSTRHPSGMWTPPASRHRS